MLQGLILVAKQVLSTQNLINLILHLIIQFLNKSHPYRKREYPVDINSLLSTKYDQNYNLPTSSEGDIQSLQKGNNFKDRIFQLKNKFKISPLEMKPRFHEYIGVIETKSNQLLFPLVFKDSRNSNSNQMRVQRKIQSDLINRIHSKYLQNMLNNKILEINNIFEKDVDSSAYFASSNTKSKKSKYSGLVEKELDEAKMKNLINHRNLFVDVPFSGIVDSIYSIKEAPIFSQILKEVFIKADNFTKTVTNVFDYFTDPMNLLDAIYNSGGGLVLQPTIEARIQILQALSPFLFRRGMS